ncbi:MAG: histidine--tRNA ligase [bacterium]
MSKPSIPKGTRDFSPVEVERRNYIFNTIRNTFKKYGYQAIETPTMENLSTLTGKYGEEGDQLIFKVLNSGDFLAKASEEKLNAKNSKAITSEISEKALRYDLTVPFARYVVMHQNEIALPFKRYQIQPVWRADRPQKGRYREFYQCDADVVGSDSLLNEAEFICIYDEALSNLGFKDFSVLINNRKILAGISEYVGKTELLIDMTVAIDKLDKIGLEGVKNELLTKGFTESDLIKLEPVILLNGTSEEKIKSLKNILVDSEIGKNGIEELEKVFSILKNFNLRNAKVELDITLARGLNYYTGAIFEVKTHEVAMGSIGGGGRYDDLTGMFGLKNLTGVGISFGADRIYDVMEELNLFPENALSTTKVLITHFDEKAFDYALPIIAKLRNNNISSELYPNISKMQKQMKYANDKGVAFVIVIGDTEMQTGKLAFKNMLTGSQTELTIEEIINELK